MSLLAELLAPIEEGAPTGPELRGSNEFAEIEKAFQDADQPASMSPVDAELEPAEDFGLVVELSSEFLRSHSKDLKVAVFLTASLLRVEGFKGLADGLEVILGLLREYWGDLHPGIPSRAPILDWLGSDDFSFALFLQPLTEFGHRFKAYKEWVAKGGAEREEEEGEEEEGADGGFNSAFGQTSREWYEEVVAHLHRCSQNLAALDALGKEKFEEAGVKPPRYASLADALRRFSGAAEDLLGRKPAPPPETVPDPTQVVEEDGISPGVGGAEGGPAPSPPTSGISIPKTKEEAATLVALAAATLRKENPGNPSPYLLIRGLRWGELRAGGTHVDPRWLEPPTTAQRTHLKGLFLDKRYEALLNAVEEIMATPAGRGWLDLQRYAVLAAERSGPGFQLVAKAIGSALRSLLQDLPGLVDATLMDDSPTASRDTVAWLGEEGFLTGPQPEGEDEAEARSRRGERVIREAGYDRAAAMAQGGDPQGAIELLMARADHEGSVRARFLTKSAAAEIMVDHGMALVARPLLDELLGLIEQHGLETWEPAEIVARPLSLFIRCLEPGEDHRKEEIYPRLAKLDPVLAMRVARTLESAGEETDMMGGEEEYG